MRKEFGRKKFYFFKIFVYGLEEVIWWVLKCWTWETIWREELHLNLSQSGTLITIQVLNNMLNTGFKNLCTYLICCMSCTKVYCSTRRKKTKIVKEGKYFTAGLMNGCNDSPSMELIKACNSAHDIVCVVAAKAFMQIRLIQEYKDKTITHTLPRALSLHRVPLVPLGTSRSTGYLPLFLTSLFTSYSLYKPISIS